MKALNRLFATLFLLCIAGMATAQDVIVMKDQSTVMSKVLEITNTEIKYKKWNSQDGPTYSISRSEVASINYENGEVENFSNLTNQPNTNQQPTQEPNGGYMEHLSNRVKLNGKILSNEEVKNLVDEWSYQIYLKGRRKALIQDLCLAGGGLAFAGACICAIYKKKGGIISLGVVSGLGLIGWLCIDGRDEMKQVATEYNYRQNNHYSFNIAPSLITCETQQSPNNYGLGFTLSINF
jgi:hypothetical protein